MGKSTMDRGVGITRLEKGGKGVGQCVCDDGKKKKDTGKCEKSKKPKKEYQPSCVEGAVWGEDGGVRECACVGKN